MKASDLLERKLARLGAVARLAAIEQERAAILKAFPDLRRSGAVTDFGVTPTGRPKRTFSAAAKRRMSAGMRRYWARRKAQSK